MIESSEREVPHVIKVCLRVECNYHAASDQHEAWKILIHTWSSKETYFDWPNDGSQYFLGSNAPAINPQTLSALEEFFDIEEQKSFLGLIR